MSQAGIININGGGGAGSPVQTLTGDTGGAVPPTANNINIVGGTGVTVAGNPGTSTLTINLTDVATSYVNVVGPTTYDVTASDYFISCNSTGGAITIRLPNVPTQYDQYVIKDRTGTAGGVGTAITVTTVGGAVLIDGAASYTISDNFESIELLFNGTSYEIF